MVKTKFQKWLDRIPESRHCQVCGESTWHADSALEIAKVQAKYCDNDFQKGVLHIFSEVVETPPRFLRVAFLEGDAKFQGRDRDGAGVFHFSKKYGYTAGHALAIIDVLCERNTDDFTVLVYHPLERDTNLYEDEVSDDEIDCGDMDVAPSGVTRMASWSEYITHPDTVVKEIDLQG